ncbi:MAG: hypothetical protein ACRYFX_00980 [Janthinobacterium lividum]
MKKCVYGLLALAVAACGKPSEKLANLLTQSDFEAVQGWSCEATSPSLTQEQAHSGRYSAKAAPGIDYSLGYQGTLGKLVPARVAKLRLRAWVYVVPGDKASTVLVTEVRNPSQEKPLLWDGAGLVELAQKDGFSKWLLVEQDIAIPAEAGADSELRVYLWRNTSTQPVYLDDVQLLKAD